MYPRSDVDFGKKREGIVAGGKINGRRVALLIDHFGFGSGDSTIEGVKNSNVGL